jgi:hypothetical protein
MDNKGSSYPDISNLNISGKENSTVNQTSNNSNTSNNPLNNYGDICLDLNPDNYPKKYRKFVTELITLLNYISISNEMIDNVDYKKPLDEGVREMVSQVRDLDKNLQM